MHKKNDSEIDISRTAKKKSMERYKIIGKWLLRLNNTQLSHIPLNVELIDALEKAKKINIGNSLNRQISFVVKQIKHSDYRSIERALEKIKQQDYLYNRITSTSEQWLGKLLIKDKEVLGEFIERYPACNKQKLKQLVRNSIQEDLKCQEDEEVNKSANNNKYKKELFKLIRTCIESK